LWARTIADGEIKILNISWKGTGPEGIRFGRGKDLLENGHEVRKATIKEDDEKGSRW